MTSMEDARAYAEKIRAAVDALNACVSEAAQRGIKVELSALDTQMFGGMRTAMVTINEVSLNVLTSP